MDEDKILTDSVDEDCCTVPPEYALYQSKAEFDASQAFGLIRKRTRTLAVNAVKLNNTFPIILESEKFSCISDSSINRICVPQ